MKPVCSHAFKTLLILSIPNMSSSPSFVPRRSPRLAAKATSNSSQSIYASYSREEARTMYVRYSESSKYLDNSWTNRECHQICLATIHVFMNAVREARGRTGRAVLATALNKHLLQNAVFLGLSERFANTVQLKMEEFLKEPAIPDAVVDADFRSSTKDVLYVLTGK